MAGAFSTHSYQQERATEQQYVPTHTPVPMTFLVAKTVNQHTSMRLLKVLLDSGGSATMAHERILPRGCTPTLLDNPTTSTTIAGTFTSKRSVCLRDLVLPEFDRNKKIDYQGAYVFGGECRYDVILGRDFLSKVGMKFDFSKNTITWEDVEVAMRSAEGELHDRVLDSTDEAYECAELEDKLDAFSSTILDAKYESHTPDEVADKQVHLTPAQRSDIKRLVTKYNKLFSGELRKYPHRTFSLEIDPQAQPIHARPFTVPRAHEDVFKKELEHLCEIGVLRPVGATEWASPTFIIPKKDGRVRWVSDFRELNKVIKRRVYPLPRINEVLKRRSGYEFFSKLDISMMFYTLELDDASKDLCTISTPYGKFQYCRLPMGVKCSPDMAQETMEAVLRGIDCEVYIDDIGAFSNDWDSHVALLDKILQRLEDNGFMVNPLKCEWGVKETDWLGYWLTPVGLKPWQKKVDAILKMKAPQNIKQLRSFIGAVNYYRDLWPRRAHVLQPLTALTGKGQFIWTEVHQRAFEEMKAVMAADVLMRYPDHNKPFEIYTDASDYQIGACIMQDGQPVAYYSKKLTPAQVNYTTMEKELLAIVMTLTEFRSTLLGAVIHVYTDHKNLTYRTLTNQRVLRWRLFLEDYDITYHYLEGKNNVLGDAFSRLPRMDAISERESAAPAPGLEESLFSSIIDSPDLLDCFLNLPAPQQMRNPIEIAWIQENQFEDAELEQMRQQHPLNFPVRHFGNHPLVCYRHDHLDQNELGWKICIPTALLQNTVEWFHRILGHAGSTRVYDSIRARFHHPQLKSTIEAFCANCRVCKEHKLQGAGYGELAPRDVTQWPWSEVHVDLIGPWNVTVNNIDVQFKALTCIDPVTNLVELVRVENATSAHIAQQFQNCWLSRYPWPFRCVHDNGSEFIGWEFQQLLEQCAIADSPTTSRNPQSNAVCERMHQTVGNVLRTLLHGENVTAATAAAIVDNALATAMHATRAANSRALSGHSPGELAFHRHMFLDIPLQADLDALQQRRQVLVDRNLAKANQRRIRHDYQPGQRVFVKAINPGKLQLRSQGPFVIQQVHTNGTITIRKTPHVTERLNIRRVFPAP